MRDTHGKCLLATAGLAAVRHVPVDADQARQALHEAGRLPKHHVEQDLHRQAGLESSLAVDGLRPHLPVGFALKPCQD